MGAGEVLVDPDSDVELPEVTVVDHEESAALQVSMESSDRPTPFKNIVDLKKDIGWKKEMFTVRNPIDGKQKYYMSTLMFHRPCTFLKNMCPKVFLK